MVVVVVVVVGTYSKPSCFCFFQLLSVLSKVLAGLHDFSLLFSMVRNELLSLIEAERFWLYQKFLVIFIHRTISCAFWIYFKKNQSKQMLVDLSWKHFAGS